MKSKCLTWVLLALIAVAVQLSAQEDESDRRFFEVTKAKAETGDPQAQCNLGVCYDKGQGVVMDAVEAVKWYRKAAGKNYAAAQYNLAFSYANGRGVAMDEVEAVKWYRKAAEQNFAAAQSNLGICYDNGQGVAKDMAEAVKWYRKAAEQNNAYAQCNLGFCYDKGQGVTMDNVEAVKWYRKAAEQNFAAAQCNLGVSYARGEGVSKDEVEAVKWYRKAAEQNYATAQFNLGGCYARGEGIAKDDVAAAKWWRKAADQNNAYAQCNLGYSYFNGRGVTKDYLEAVKLFRKAADRNVGVAQTGLGSCYMLGEGVSKNSVEAYRWLLLAAAQGEQDAKDLIPGLENRMTREQIAEGQKLAGNFKPQEASESSVATLNRDHVDAQPTSSGTGFFISDDGYLISNNHVVEGANQVRLVTSAGLISAKVVKVDAANDLALLKAEGRFAALPVAASRGVKLGGTVATVGFPNIGLQGFAPKLAKGEIASLSGAGDDARYFQISVPVQPGNSGGALVDERGNVVGVVSAKLNASAALRSSGALPENVNYAVKSSYLLSFLESVPEVAAKLKEPSGKEKKFEDVVKEAEQAAVLVLVY